MDLHGLFRFCLVIVLSRTEPGVASRRRGQPRPVYKEWPETLTCEDRASNVGGLVMATIRPDGR